MGLMGNGTQELKSNEDPKFDHLTPNKHKMGGQKLVTEAQHTEKKLISEGGIFRVGERESNHTKSSEIMVGEKQELKLVDMKTSPAAENLDEASNNRLMVFKTVGIPPGFESFVNPSNGNLEPVKAAAISMSGDVENGGNLESVATGAVSVTDNVDNEGSIESGQTAAVSPSGTADNEGNLESVQIAAVNISRTIDGEDAVSPEPLRKHKVKLIVPVTSSWSLRSKSQEKPKVPEPIETVKEGNADGVKKRVRKKKQPKKNRDNEYLSMKGHLKYLIQRIKYEQSLIDAYSAEGWKGQSLEKLKPEKELQRAKSHILHYKLRIRELFQRLDASLAVGKLPATLFDSAGEIDSEDIFCAKCGSKDLSLDNDIILCDGACERGFHQYCLEPPLLIENIPPGDEGWLCPGCDCKVDCIDVLKDIQGPKISVTDSWEKIFPEVAAVLSGETPDGHSGLPSDDSEDDDYDPDNPETAGKVEGDVSSSASDDLATRANNENLLNLPSDDSEDDDFDPSVVNQDKLVEEQADSSSSDFSSDSEDLGALLEDDTVPDTDVGKIPPSLDRGQLSADSEEENGRLDSKKRPSMKDELSYLMDTSEPVSGRRHVQRLDYKKLRDDTYGNSSSDSSDEDFDGSIAHSSEEDSITPQKRRKTNPEKTVLESPEKTPISKSTSTINVESQRETKDTPKRTSKPKSNTSENNESTEVGKADDSNRKSANRRLGEAVTQRLYASFNENKYPERAVKEKLASELGLKVQQISKWFENTRWSFNHKPQMELNAAEKPPEPQPKVEPLANISASAGNFSTSKSRNRKNKSNQAPEDIIKVTDRAPNLKVEETIVTGTAQYPKVGDVMVTSETNRASAGNSSSLKSRKRKAKSSQAPPEDTMVTDNILNQKVKDTVVSDKPQNQKVEDTVVTDKARNQKVEDTVVTLVTNSTSAGNSSSSKVRTRKAKSNQAMEDTAAIDNMLNQKAEDTVVTLATNSVSAGNSSSSKLRTRVAKSNQAMEDTMATDNMLNQKAEDTLITLATNSTSAGNSPSSKLRNRKAKSNQDTVVALATNSTNPGNASSSKLRTRTAKSNQAMEDTVVADNKSNQKAEDSVVTLATNSTSAGNSSSSKLRNRKAKSNQAAEDTAVTVNALNLKVEDTVVTVNAPNLKVNDTVITDKAHNQEVEDTKVTLANNSTSAGNSASSKLRNRKAKSNQAAEDTMVTVNAPNQIVEDTVIIDKAHNQAVEEDAKVTLATLFMTAGKSSTSKSRKRKAKSNQVPADAIVTNKAPNLKVDDSTVIDKAQNQNMEDTIVTDKALKQKGKVDMKLPQVRRTSMRLTRSNHSVA